jgi:hypothetical protein
LRFAIKPRIRIWNQSGVKELVTVTAPKRIEHNYTNGLSQTEVRSRLRALADTLDSRGWAIKNTDVNMYSQTDFGMGAVDTSDRLVNMASLPQPVPTLDIQASDDIMDAQNNRVAMKFNNMIEASSKAHREQIMQRMQASDEPVSQPQVPAAPPAKSMAPPMPLPPAPRQGQQPANNYWFLNQPTQGATTVPTGVVTFNTQVVTPGMPIQDVPVVAAAKPTPDDEALIKRIAQQSAAPVDSYSHLHTLLPLSAQGQQTANTAPADAPSQNQQKTMPPVVTHAPDPAIVDLASNDDLNVATIAREAHKRMEPPADEVVISLH